tara:strand:+ start:37 stop:627 length:591 start_codon:yes stop_codon:yes gene_type:complete
MSVVYVNNITIDSGEDFSQDFTLLESGGKFVDLTNYSAKGQIRKHADSSTAITFQIGYINRLQGKIELNIPRWTTCLLKPGRYVYDVMVTKPNGTKEMVLEGTALVRPGASKSTEYSSPGSDDRTCIAVIDDSLQTTADMLTKWEQFRTTYPNRTFYLLQPTSDGFGNFVTDTNWNALKTPDNFLAETTINISPLI